MKSMDAETLTGMDWEPGTYWTLVRFTGSRRALRARIRNWRGREEQRLVRALAVAKSRDDLSALQAKACVLATICEAALGKRTVNRIKMQPQINKRTRYPGISDHAKRLGVTRPHLWMVLQGKRKSRRLMERYRKMIGAEVRK